MTKKHLIVGMLASAIAVATVLVFGAIMVGKAAAWNSEHRMLSSPLQAAVNAGGFIHRYPVSVALAVIGLCFCSVWLAVRIFAKR